MRSLANVALTCCFFTCHAFFTEASATAADTYGIANYDFAKESCSPIVPKKIFASSPDVGIADIVPALLDKSSPTAPIQSGFSVAKDKNAKSIMNMFELYSQDAPDVLPSQVAVDSQLSPLFGYSLEGDWRIDLNPNVAENTKKKASEILSTGTDVQVEFYYFTQD